MSKPVYIADIIGEAVASASDSILSTIQDNETCVLGKTGIVTINFQKGHKRELIETLIEMDRSQTHGQRKYPCVYLVQDFQETRNPRAGIYADTRLSIIIMHYTEQTRKVDDRMVKVFKPVLYPIYEAVLEALAKHPMIQQSNRESIVHTKTDRLYWGRQAVGGNDRVALTDYLDAIEITGLQLSFYFKNC